MGVCADASLCEASGKAATATNKAAAHLNACTILVIDLPNRSSSRDPDPRSARILDYGFVVRNARLRSDRLNGECHLYQLPHDPTPMNRFAWPLLFVLAACPIET